MRMLRVIHAVPHDGVVMIDLQLCLQVLPAAFESQPLTPWISAC